MFDTFDKLDILNKGCTLHKEKPLDISIKWFHKKAQTESIGLIICRLLSEVRSCIYLSLSKLTNKFLNYSILFYYCTILIKKFKIFVFRGAKERGFHTIFLDKIIDVFLNISGDCVSV